MKKLEINQGRADKLRNMLAFKSCLHFRQAMCHFYGGLNLDEEGIITSRLYYMPKGNTVMRPDQSVQIYGNFTESPWTHFIQCKYDYSKKMFYHETKIKIGHQFKFLVDDDSHLVSKEFDIIQDGQGNQNNIFIPNIKFSEFDCPNPVDALEMAFTDLIG